MSMSRQFLYNIDGLMFIRAGAGVPQNFQVSDIHSIMYYVYIMFNTNLSFILQDSGADFRTLSASLLASTQTLTIDHSQPVTR